MLSVPPNRRPRYSSVSDVLELWGSAAECAAEIGVDAATVRMWRYRERIPADYDIAIVRAAQARGADITIEDLARLRAAMSA